ncbi:hypothetical protein BCD67_19720 [Oscillatoriales cyanobacterium USR001]|nr:hypothetical protein BCD67_19720 [Oscillatoriales cyanobacterium USR001]
MEQIPLPSHIHYELLLQLLERKTWLAVSQKHPHQAQVQELIITIRKAAALQKQLEENCRRSNLSVEYLWSLNDIKSDSVDEESKIKD